MIKLFLLLCLTFSLSGCDSFPKRMNLEKINAPTTKDQINISIECTERANQFPLYEFKHFITIKLYVMNSSSSPIEFTPISLVTPENKELTLIEGEGASESSKKRSLSLKKLITVNPDDGFYIELEFGTNNEATIQKTTFKISDILVNKQKRPEETFTCQHINSKNY